LSKGLRAAAIVIGGIALVVGTAGVLAPAATAAFLGSMGIAASATAIATVGSAVSANRSVGAPIRRRLQ